MSVQNDADNIHDQDTDAVSDSTLADDVQRERVARERLEVLADASLILSESLDYRTTLNNLGRVLIPRFADNCIIDLLDEHGVFQEASISASHLEAEVAMHELRLNYPPDPRAGAARQVLETRQPLLVPELDDTFYERVALNEHHL